tara:strand:+ start:689 stop:931 length:243 start_codon:yes stop_codon:yes gene_type:complete
LNIVIIDFLFLNMSETDKPLNEQIRSAINRSQYTLHEFAQLMSMKLKVLESYMNGGEIPEKKTISKMNKFLGTKIKISKS